MERAAFFCLVESCDLLRFSFHTGHYQASLYLKLPFHVQTLVQYTGNNNFVALNRKNQYMLAYVEHLIAFGQIIPVMAYFRVFSKQLHPLVELLQVHVYLLFTVPGKGVLQNIP